MNFQVSSGSQGVELPLSVAQSVWFPSKVHHLTG
jgi:hypothetical protein